MRTILVGTITFLSLTSGCVSSSDSQARSEVEGEASDNDACKIEGEQIGREGQVLQLDATSVRFHDWIAKPGESNEYIGFSLTVAGTPYDHYIVKAGTKKYIADGTGWIHPDSASNAAAISNVDFCECDPPAPPPPPSCENPDGCDDGSGGQPPIL